MRDDVPKILSVLSKTIKKSEINLGPFHNTAIRSIVVFIVSLWEAETERDNETDIYNGIWRLTKDCLTAQLHNHQSTKRLTTQLVFLTMCDAKKNKKEQK